MRIADGKQQFYFYKTCTAILDTGRRRLLSLLKELPSFGRIFHRHVEQVEKVH
jgi:hypothetical protein